MVASSNFSQQFSTCVVYIEWLCSDLSLSFSRVIIFLFLHYFKVSSFSWLLFRYFFSFIFAYFFLFFTRFSDLQCTCAKGKNNFAAAAPGYVCLCVLHVILSTDTNVYAICLTFIILEQIDMNMKTHINTQMKTKTTKDNKKITSVI